MHKQSKHVGITTVIFGAMALLSGSVAMADTLDVPPFVAGNLATATSVNTAFETVESSVNDNDGRITSIEQRLVPLENSLNGEVVTVDCSTDSAALKNLTLTPNTTYTLTGICDGQIIVGAGLGTINIESDGTGGPDGITLQAGETDADTVFAAIYGNNGVRLILTNLVITVDSSYNAVDDLYIAGVGSYWGARVILDQVSVVGGDEGISAYNNGMISVWEGVTITGFRDAGIKASRASVIRVNDPVTVTGGSNQEGTNSEAIVGLDGGVVAMTGGGTITPASGTGISAALETSAAISAFRNGVITVSDITLNGSVWSGESSTVDLRNVTQSGGNLDIYRNSVLRVRASNVSGAAGDVIWAGAFSTIRMDDTTIGNASGTETINLYSYGIIDLRVLSGTMDMNFRDINCSDPRSVRLFGAISNQGNISC